MWSQLGFWCLDACMFSKQTVFRVLPKGFIFLAEVAAAKLFVGVRLRRGG